MYNRDSRLVAMYIVCGHLFVQVYTEVPSCDLISYLLKFLNIAERRLGMLPSCHYCAVHQRRTTAQFMIEITPNTSGVGHKPVHSHPSTAIHVVAVQSGVMN